MHKKTSDLLKIFYTFYRLRELETENTLKNINVQKLDYNDAKVDKFCGRINQALPFAELQCFNRDDYFDAVINLVNINLIEKNIAFVAFFYQRFGMPQPSWFETESIPKYLIEWLYKNGKILKTYDFSFHDFESAFKEACYKQYQDDVIMLS